MIRHRYMIAALALLALIASGKTAAAQSGCSNIVQGAVLTAAQWNQCFQGKQDTVTGGIPTPGGSLGNLQYNIGGAFGGATGTTWDNINGSLQINTGTPITTSHPLLDLAQTWNAGGVTFTGIRMNISNAASVASSPFVDYQISGTSYAQVWTPVPPLNSGNFGPAFMLNGGGTMIGMTAISPPTPGLLYFGTTSTAIASMKLSEGTVFGNPPAVQVYSTGAFSWSSSTNASNNGDTAIFRNAPGVISLGDTTGTQTGFVQTGGMKRITSDQAFTSNTTLTALTGLSVNLVAGRTYTFEIDLFITTGASAGGFKVAVGGSSTAGTLIVDAMAMDGTTPLAVTRRTAFGAGNEVVAVLNSGTAPWVRLFGTITPGSSGTFGPRAAQNVSSGTATTFKQGSYFMVYDMP